MSTFIPLSLLQIVFILLTQSCFSLYFQCRGLSAEWACQGLAEVYYAAVRAFGGGDATKREEANADLVKIYDEAVAEYERRVKEAQDAGLLWTE
jgi:hypothetical protein